MKNFFVYTLLVMCTLLMIYTVQADKTEDLSAYPEKDYLVGVMEGMNVSKEVLRVRAETLLTEKVFDKVRVLLEGNSMNKEAYDQVWEHYGLILQGAENAKLTGLNTRSGDSYIIAYIKRRDLQSAYSQQETELRNRINSIIGRAQAADNSGELDSAAKIFMSSYPLYEELKEAELIQLGAKYNLNGNEFANLHAAAAGTVKGTLTMSHKEVIKRVNELRDPPIYNLDTIADFAANQFREQNSPSMGGKVQQGNIMYGSIHSSPHASGTATAIALKLGWSLVPPTRALRPVQGNPNSSGTSRTPLKIYGTYWEDGDRITLRTALRDVTTGKFKACAVVPFQESKRQDAAHIKIKPTGYAVAKQNRQIYGGGTTKGNVGGGTTSGTTSGNVGSGTTGNTSQIQTQTITSGSLAVTIDTDRGTGPITLSEGEIVTLYVSANQEAYLQLVYVLQDGRRILLMDNNYHIDSSKVGTAVEIGQFECAPPFGIEELYVYAQPTPFPEFKPGETYEQDGFVFLKEKKTRALRLVRPKNVLSITTTP